MKKQHIRRRQHQPTQGRPRCQAENAAQGSTGSAPAGCAKGTLPEIGPPTHSCAAQLPGGVQGVREQQSLAAGDGAGPEWVPAWPTQPQEPRIHPWTADNTLANAMID